MTFSGFVVDHVFHCFPVYFFYVKYSSVNWGVQKGDCVRQSYKAVD